MNIAVCKGKGKPFHVVVFEGEGATVAELERQLRISDHCLRYITVKVDPDRPPLDIGRAARPEGEASDREAPAPTAAAPAAEGTAPPSDDAGAAS